MPNEVSHNPNYHEDDPNKIAQNSCHGNANA